MKEISQREISEWWPISKGSQSFELYSKAHENHIKAQGMIMNLLQKEATMTDDYKKLYNKVLSGNYEDSLFQESYFLAAIQACSCVLASFELLCKFATNLEPHITVQIHP